MFEVHGLSLVLLACFVIIAPVGRSRQALAEAFKHTCAITCIDLSGDSMGDSGAEARLISSVHQCGSLILLASALLESSCQALADALRQNSAITHIDLRGNSIGDSGAKARVFQTCRLYSGIFICILSGPCGSPEAELHRHVHQPP